MNKIIILMFGASLLFAVQPVARDNNPRSGDKDDNKIKTEKVINDNKDNKDSKTNKAVINDKDDKKNDRKDRFQDIDSNGVNDQREDDLQKIKNLNSKFKDLIKKIDKGTKSTKKKNK